MNFRGISADDVTIPEERFSGDGVTFKCKLIGVDPVTSPRGDKMCQNSLQRLKAIKKGTSSHKQRILMNVSFDGIKLTDEKAGDMIGLHPIPLISYISRDNADTRAFGYVYGSPETGHQFYGIKTEKAALPVMKTIGHLFSYVFEKKKRELEEKQKEVVIEQEKSFTGSCDLDRNSVKMESSNRIRVDSPNFPSVPPPPPPRNDSTRSVVCATNLSHRVFNMSSLKDVVVSANAAADCEDKFGSSTGSNSWQAFNDDDFDQRSSSIQSTTESSQLADHKSESSKANTEFFADFSSIKDQNSATIEQPDSVSDRDRYAAFSEIHAMTSSIFDTLEEAATNNLLDSNNDETIYSQNEAQAPVNRINVTVDENDVFNADWLSSVFTENVLLGATGNTLLANDGIAKSPLSLTSFADAPPKPQRVNTPEVYAFDTAMFSDPLGKDKPFDKNDFQEIRHSPMLPSNNVGSSPCDRQQLSRQDDVSSMSDCEINDSKRSNSTNASISLSRRSSSAMRASPSNPFVGVKTVESSRDLFDDPFLVPLSMSSAFMPSPNVSPLVSSNEFLSRRFTSNEKSVQAPVPSSFSEVPSLPPHPCPRQPSSSLVASNSRTSSPLTNPFHPFSDVSSSPCDSPPPPPPRPPRPPPRECSALGCDIPTPPRPPPRSGEGAQGCAIPPPPLPRRKPLNSFQSPSIINPFAPPNHYAPPPPADDECSDDSSHTPPIPVPMRRTQNQSLKPRELCPSNQSKDLYTNDFFSDSFSKDSFGFPYKKVTTSDAKDSQALRNEPNYCLPSEFLFDNDFNKNEMNAESSLYEAIPLSSLESHQVSTPLTLTSPSSCKLNGSGKKEEVKLIHDQAFGLPVPPPRLDIALSSISCANTSDSNSNNRSGAEFSSVFEAIDLNVTKFSENSHPVTSSRNNVTFPVDFDKAFNAKNNEFNEQTEQKSPNFNNANSNSDEILGTNSFDSPNLSSLVEGKAKRLPNTTVSNGVFNHFGDDHISPPERNIFKKKDDPFADDDFFAS